MRFDVYKMNCHATDMIRTEQTKSSIPIHDLTRYLTIYRHHYPPTAEIRISLNLFRFIRQRIHSDVLGNRRR